MATEKMEFEEVGAAVSPLDIPGSGNAEHTETAERHETAPVASGSERTAAELDAYKRHFAALQEELDGIAEKYQSPETSDPALEKRFSALESGMKEIKELLQKTQQLPPTPAPQPVQYVPQYQPQPMPQFYTPSPVISTPAPIMPPIIQPSYGR